MNCERIEELFANYLDGVDVPDADAAEFEMHLASCADCKGLVEKLARQHRDMLYLNAMEAQETPRRTVSESPFSRGRVIAFGFGVAAAAAAVLIAVALMRGSSEPPTNLAKQPEPIPTTPTPAPAAEVAVVEGRVLRTPFDSRDVRVERPGEWLFAGDRLFVDQGGEAAIRFIDGARARLSPGAMLTVYGPSRAERCFLSAGRAHFTVPPQRSQWRVKTPDADIDVLGTEFDVDVIRTGAARR